LSISQEKISTGIANLLRLPNHMEKPSKGPAWITSPPRAPEERVRERERERDREKERERERESERKRESE